MGRSFRFLKTLGEGAFGAVHLAEVQEEDFVQVLAVKWLHMRWSQSAEYGKRLRDEARLLALLRHQAIVRVHGLTRIDGRLAILMEAIDGADLGRVKSLPAAAALEICAAVADALDAAWSEIPQGSSSPLHVVHRDIKPSNVMVTARGAVKVMDFGVARASFDSREAETRSQQFGTARYMAPERWLEGVANAPSDVFSLGVTVLELISGEPVPQPRLSQEGFQADLGAAVDRLRDQPELQELVRAMVAFSPADRLSAAEVARRAAALIPTAQGDSLRAWAAAVVPTLRNEGVDSPLTGTVVREESGTSLETLGFESDDVEMEAYTAPLSLPPVRTQRTERPRRLPLLFAGLVGASLVLLAGSQWLGTDRRREVPPPAPTLSAAPAPAPAQPVADAVEDPPVEVADTAPVPTPAPAPEPRPTRQPPPPPAPEPAPEPESQAAGCTGMLVITAAPGVLVETQRGEVSGHRALSGFPCGATTLTVIREGQRKPCEIAVEAGRNEVRVDAAGTCAQK